MELFLIGTSALCALWIFPPMLREARLAHARNALEQYRDFQAYGRRPPVFVGYDFIGLQGLDGKMSGSKGGAMTPGEILEVYEPEILMWLYLRKPPHASFNVAFDTDVYRIYDEFDREVAKAAKGELGAAEQTALELATRGAVPLKERLSFRQIVGMGQIVQWDLEKFVAIAEQVGSSDSRAELSQRL